MAERTLKAGVVGLGRGAARMVREMDVSPSVELYAAADIDADVLARFQAKFPRARAYDSIEKLAADPEVDAVFLSTPNRLHAEHAILLAEAGKHVMVQTPMAITLKEMEEMVAAAEQNNVHLLEGHSLAYMNWVRMIRQIVRSGELGKLGAIHVYASNAWLISVRTPEDLDPEEGGGVMFRNAPHQIDCIRLIGGGMLTSVRGTYSTWMPERSSPGYYAAYMEFADGTPAVVVQNSNGYFSLDELVNKRPGPREQAPGVVERGAVRAAIRDGSRDDKATYVEMGIGRSLDYGNAGTTAASSGLSDEGFADYDLPPGMVVVSCERGDILQSPNGLYVYSDEGLREVKMEQAGHQFIWYLQLEELYNVVVRGHKPFHSGRWGLATMEVALAIMESARTHRDVELTHQVEMDEDFDRVYRITPTEVTQFA